MSTPLLRGHPKPIRLTDYRITPRTTESRLGLEFESRQFLGNTKTMITMITMITTLVKIKRGKKVNLVEFDKAGGRRPPVLCLVPVPFASSWVKI